MSRRGARARPSATRDPSPRAASPAPHGRGAKFGGDVRGGAGRGASRGAGPRRPVPLPPPSPPPPPSPNLPRRARGAAPRRTDGSARYGSAPHRPRTGGRDGGREGRTAPPRAAAPGRGPPLRSERRAGERGAAPGQPRAEPNRGRRMDGEGGRKGGGGRARGWGRCWDLGLVGPSNSSPHPPPPPPRWTRDIPEGPCPVHVRPDGCPLPHRPRRHPASRRPPAPTGAAGTVRCRSPVSLPPPPAPSRGRSCPGAAPASNGEPAGRSCPVAGGAAGDPPPRRASPPGPPASLSRSPLPSRCRIAPSRPRPGPPLRCAARAAPPYPPIPPALGGGGLRSDPAGRWVSPSPGRSCGQRGAGAAPPPPRCLPAACPLPALAIFRSLSARLRFLPSPHTSFPRDVWGRMAEESHHHRHPPPPRTRPGRLQMEAGPETEDWPMAPHAVGQSRGSGGWGAPLVRAAWLRHPSVPSAPSHPLPRYCLTPAVASAPKLNAWGGGGELAVCGCQRSTQPPPTPPRQAPPGREDSPLPPTIAWVPLPLWGCSHLWGVGAGRNVGLGASLPFGVPRLR